MRPRGASPYRGPGAWAMAVADTSQPFPAATRHGGVTEASWEDVYTAHYRRLVVLVSAVAGSRVEAEEAVQEAFVRALGLTGRRAVVDDPEAWLYRVAV